MAKELTPLGQFVKWALLPALVAAIGYRFIGPNIGGIGLGEKIPGVRSIGKEIANKVKGKDPEAEAAKPGAKPERKPAETTPSSGGATEFQRIREESPRRIRRGPLDSVD